MKECVTERYEEMNGMIKKDLDLDMLMTDDLLWIHPEMDRPCLLSQSVS